MKNLFSSFKEIFIRNFFVFNLLLNLFIAYIIISFSVGFVNVLILNNISLDIIVIFLYVFYIIFLIIKNIIDYLVEK